MLPEELLLGGLADPHLNMEIGIIFGRAPLFLSYS